MGEGIKLSVKEIVNTETQKVNEDFLRFVEDYICLLKEMGNFVVTMGNTEQKHPDMFEQVKKLGSPEVLETLVDKIPPDILASMFKTLIRFTKLAQVSDVISLRPEKKITVGEEMIAISNELNVLMKKAGAK